MPDMPYEDVQIEGHLIDSLMMPHIMDEVMDLDGEFEMLTFEVGRMKDDPSHAVMRIFGRDAAHLDEILTAITEFGVVAVKPQDVVLEAADMDGVFPDAFYSTTNLTTFVRVGGEWIRVEHPGDGLRHPRGRRGGHRRDGGDERREGRRPLRHRPPRHPRAPARAAAREPAVRVHGVGRQQREAQGADRARGGAHPAPGQGGGPADDRRRRPGRGAHGGGAAAGPPHRGRLRGLRVRRQRRRHPRHREQPLRHVARHQPRSRATPVPGRPRAPPARHQHHPPRRQHPGRRRPGHPDRRPHVHAHEDGHAVRARRQHPRRRADARGDHRRDAGAEGDARATRSRPAPA